MTRPIVFRLCVDGRFYRWICVKPTLRVTFHKEWRKAFNEARHWREPKWHIYRTFVFPYDSVRVAANKLHQPLNIRYTKTLCQLRTRRTSEMRLLPRTY